MSSHRLQFWLTIALVFLASLPPPLAAPASRVVTARNPRAVDGRNQCNPIETARLFDRALLELTGAKTAAEAWKALGLTADDTVAIKVNCNSWTIALNPHPELVGALLGSLQAVIPAERIIVYEAFRRDLVRAGWRPKRTGSGPRFYCADEGDGFDRTEGLTNIICATATKIINLASLKGIDDGKWGASLFLKNHVGSLMPAEMPKCHDDPDFLASISARRSIRRKTILNMCDGLRGTYRRGVPWYWQGIILARDPLAAEAVAIGVINEKRVQEGLPPLPLPDSLLIAEAKYRLGTCREANIERVRIDM